MNRTRSFLTVIASATALVLACSAGGSGTSNNGLGDPTASGGTGVSLGGSSSGTNPSGGTVNTNGGTIAVSGTAGSGGTVTMDPDTRMPACASGCADLASSGPLLDPGVPANVDSMFSGSPSGAGPCVLEPGDNTLLPYNWLRPRVHLSGAAAGAVYQIKVSTPREADVLTAYTNKDTWILPQEYWDDAGTTGADPMNPKGLTYNVFDEDITVTVRAQSGGATSVKFRIAPVKAAGSMVFWSSTTTDPGSKTNALYGFAPGDEGITAALKPLDVLTTIMDETAGTPKRAITDTNDGPVPAGRVRCVGCHTSTPDGAAVNITDHWPWNVRLVNITSDGRGNAPSYVTPMGDMLMQMPWQGVTSYSKADWDAGNHRYVTSFGKRPSMYMSQPWTFWAVDSDNGVQTAYTGEDDLIWLDVAAPGTPPPDVAKEETTGMQSNTDNAIAKACVAAQGTGWDIITRTGDTHGAVLPDWSHDGTRIVYTSTDSTADGHVGWEPGKNVQPPTVVDLYTVPFNAGKGGAATPVMGASNAADAEYYPDFSADDALIAFTRVANFKALQTDDDSKKIYYRPQAEVYVVPSNGGTALSLAANTPPACSGEASPGVYNSWPKWSPIVREANGKKYYFLIFSSARESPGFVKDSGGNATSSPMSQLYMTALTADAAGTLTSYGAAYLWNQRYLVTASADPKNPTIADFAQNNVTPAWDEFQAPAVPPVKITVR